MSNEKNYQYYLVSGQEVTDLNERWSEVSKVRKAALLKMSSESGADVWTERQGWGEHGTLVDQLAFADDHQFPVPVTIKCVDFFAGKKVVIVRGKGRTKEAREFNAQLDAYVKAANAVLAKHPSYQDFLIAHYKVSLCTLGASSTIRIGAVSMISTYCGSLPGDENTLAFAIPIAREKNDKQPAVPASFEEITYGRFFDLTNPPSIE